MASAQVKPGDVLGGKYRVERVLGAGGMGIVVAARHVQLGQRVALKLMLKDAMDDPANAERFAREARAAVRLQSAHTARVLDVGKLKNGEPYIVMEYLDGQDLDEVLRARGPLPPHVAVDYILQVCEAFAEAHALGMIHRDIKLKNIFLTKTVDGRPLVKVLDFGLAKTAGAMGDVSITTTTAVFGSPQYMSPEQMRSAKDVDARSDIWSIGVSLYELLTARVPFDAPGVAEICAMVLKDPVEPPSKWNLGLPPDLDAVVVKCLAKKPEDRFQSVAELAVALEPWSTSEGSSQRILHVMGSVQRADAGTLADMGAGAATDVDANAKTMNAWDSGESGGGRTKLRPRVVWALSAAFALAGVLLIGGAAAVRNHKKQTATATVAASAPEKAPPTSPAAPSDTTPAPPADPPVLARSEPLPPPAPAVAVAAPEPRAPEPVTTPDAPTPPPPTTTPTSSAHPSTPPTSKALPAIKPPKPAPSAKSVPPTMDRR